MLITFDLSGNLPDSQTAYLVLYIAGLPDTLLLSEFVEDPYVLAREGYDKSDGRSLTGSIKTKGNQYDPTKIWHLAFAVNRTQADLFESILAAQRNGGQAVLVDSFKAAGVSTTVYLDADDRYLTSIGFDWYLLQFTAREER